MSKPRVVSNSLPSEEPQFANRRGPSPTPIGPANTNETRQNQLEPVCHLVIGPSVLKRQDGVPRDTQIFLAQNGGSPCGNDFHEFRTGDVLHYDAFCDDFGPMNALSVMQFIQILDTELCNMRDSRKRNLVYSADSGPRNLTNAAFLLGSYMILKLDQTAASVSESFSRFDSNLFEAYRDASYAKPDFRLQLADCWQGLERGKAREWFTYPTQTPCMWGMIDQDAYAHYDDPLNADLHEIVPGKIVAFRGPRDLGGMEFRNNYKDGEFVNRDFSPEYYADIFEGLGVSTIVRLNNAPYDKEAFSARGMQHFDLEAEGQSPPSPQAVTRFFRIVDEAPGLVAVHGRAGLGCTGTLAALYMMRTHGFAAREAMAWIRIIRPGSIIGEQQHYIARIEQSIRRLILSVAASGLDRRPSAALAAGAREEAPFGRAVSSRSPPLAPLRPEEARGMSRKVASSTLG